MNISDKYNLLILTRSSWDDTNSLGNTLSNFWKNWNAENLANIYCRETKPNNHVCINYFSITEREIVSRLMFYKNKPGQHFSVEILKSEDVSIDKYGKKEEQLYTFFRKNPSILVLWGQNLLWEIGNWKNENLNRFLSDFKPEIIFAPCFSSIYMHKILWYVATKTSAKVVLFHADDYLSTKGLGGSILTKLNRKLRAQQVRKSALKADLNYCISLKQQQEYERILKKEMKLLYKGADFSNLPEKYQVNTNGPVRIFYIGSTLYGRWKTLGMLARAIQNINSIKPFFELHIYSQYQPSKQAMQAMVIEGCSEFLGKIPASEVTNVMHNADIVLHVESFDEQEKQKTRLSFSTKIVDCLHSARCLFAIGWEDAASIDYLVQNDAALVAFDEKSIADQLQRIIDNSAILEEYAQKAWECGKRNHQIEQIQQLLYNDLAQLVQK